MSSFFLIWCAYSNPIEHTVQYPRVRLGDDNTNGDPIAVVPAANATPGVRRSTRNRVKTLRPWMGEKAVFEVNPDGESIVFSISVLRPACCKLLRTAESK